MAFSINAVGVKLASALTSVGAATSLP